MQDFREIKLIGKIEEVPPARGGTRRITKTENIHTSLSYADFPGSLWQDFTIEETDDFTAVIRHVIFDESVDNRMDSVDFSKADIIMCSFWSFCYLDKVKPSKNNCVFKVIDEFYDCLLATIKSSDSPLKEGLIGKAKLFYAPHNTAPYEVAHPGNLSFKHPEVAELSRALYDFVCRAAETTGRRVC